MGAFIESFTVVAFSQPTSHRRDGSSVNVIQNAGNLVIEKFRISCSSPRPLKIPQLL